MAKISMGKGTAVRQELEHVLDRLLLKRPLFEFVATAYDTKTDRETGKVTNTVMCVEVLQDAERMGEIGYYRDGGRRDSGGNYPDAFKIESIYVKKQRGERNTTITIDANVAVKEAIKVFAPPTVEMVSDRLVRYAVSELESLCYRWRQTLSDVASYSGQDIMIYMIERHLTGEVLPLPKTCIIEDKKLHLYDTYLAGKQIAEGLKWHEDKRVGYAVEILTDKSIRTIPMSYMSKAGGPTDSIPLVRYRNFEEMPKEMQDKLAVLKIAQENDPILDIGVKISDTLMYIRS
jgi:hypothetical protein